MVFDALHDDPDGRAAVLEAVRLGELALLTTHVQEDQVAAIRDAVRRKALQRLPRTVVPSSVTVDGVARTGQARVNANSHYARMRDVRHFQDSLIADATAARADLLVTDDRASPARRTTSATTCGPAPSCSTGRRAAVPEGDTIHYAANKIRPVLQGHVPDSIETPHPRFGRDRWPQKLAGRAVRSVDAHGKHLFIRFENGLTIHSHLRMTGKWRMPVPATGRRHATRG